MNKSEFDKSLLKCQFPELKSDIPPGYCLELL